MIKLVAKLSGLMIGMKKKKKEKKKKRAYVASRRAAMKDFRFFPCL